MAAARAWLADERTVSATDLPLTPAVVGGTSSTLGAAFNILCTVVGTGLLNLPAGFAQSGWVGAPMLVIMCTMAGYTACVLIKCFKYIGGKESVTGELQNVLMDDVVGSSGSAETYGDIGQAAFGAFGRWFVVVQMHLTLCMVGTIYHLLAAINLIIAAVLTPPQFGSFLDLVSAFTSTFTVFILPCLFYLKLRGGPWSSPPRYINPLEIASNGLILIFNIVGATFGTVGAIQELISLAHPADPAAGNTTAMA